jgi:AcrR family transcriptional regulator
MSTASLDSGSRAEVERLSPAGRGEITRRKIQDAAEHLFAERGFHGVAIRDITQLAGVENALASYHFRTKEQLFTAVVQRRADEHRRDLESSLAGAFRRCAPGLPSNQDLVRAYATPALEKIARGPRISN